MTQSPPPSAMPPHGAQHGPYIFDAYRGEWMHTDALPPTLPPAQPPKKRKTGRLVLSGVVLAGLVFVGFHSLDITSKQDSDEGRMIALCQDVVRNVTRTPSTVKFVSSTVEPAGEGWTVSGEIDGQNLFGAVIREGYKCELTYDAEKDLFTARIVN